jgi:hypothetical protein
VCKSCSFGTFEDAEAHKKQCNVPRPPSRRGRKRRKDIFVSYTNRLTFITLRFGDETLAASDFNFSDDEEISARGFGSPVAWQDLAGWMVTRTTLDNWVWHWLSCLLMNRVKIWSLPRVAHVSSTDRNCMIFLSKFACRTCRDLSNLRLALPQ